MEEEWLHERIRDLTFMYKSKTNLDPTDIFIPIEMKEGKIGGIKLIRGLDVNWYYWGDNADIFVLNITRAH